MKKISIWAKAHTWHARLLIVFIYVLLFAIGINTGKLLKEINVGFSQPYFIACVISTLLLWICYPSGKSKSGSSVSYVQRKVFDCSFGAVTFLMLLYAGNNDVSVFKDQFVQAARITHSAKDSVNYNNHLIKDFIGSIKGIDVSKLSQKEKIKLIKKQIKKINQDKETSKGSKTLLIILSILIALGLLFGLAALSCSIACSSSGALAIIVALAGTFVIVFFLVKIIKRISNPPPAKKEEKPDTEINK